MASTPLPFRGQTACGLKPPLHPFAGSEWGIRVACDPPAQQSSHAGDDDLEVLRWHEVWKVS
jgi:hypothetical protein